MKSGNTVAIKTYLSLCVNIFKISATIVTLAHHCNMLTTIKTFEKKTILFS